MEKEQNQIKNGMELKTKGRSRGQLSFDELWEMSDDTDKKYGTRKLMNEFEGDNPSEKGLFPIILVRDFDQFIDYVENRSIRLTKTQEYISRKQLQEINNRMTVRNETANGYTDQESYPYIHLFYYLALSSRLLVKKYTKGGSSSFVQTERLQLYQELTDLEKYFFLLETFWVDLNWAKLLNERYNTLTLSQQEILFIFSKKKAGYTISINQHGEIDDDILSNRLDIWNYFLLYFEWFGLWECEINQERVDTYYRKNRYFAKSIKLTAFGTKIIPILFLERAFQIWNIPERRLNGEVNPIPGSELADMMFGDVPQKFVDEMFDRMEEDQSLQPFFCPFKDLFPHESIQRTLPRDKRKFIEGIYTFKVSFTSGVWRKVVLSGNHTMGNLHDIILGAFGFDNDHLYSFFMDGDKWSKNCITSPDDNDEGPKANKVRIGELGLASGQRFLYLFDYGAEWMFFVEADQIQEHDSELFQPYVKEGKGDAPDQYFFDE